MLLYKYLATNDPSILFAHFKTVLQMKTFLADELLSRTAYIKAVKEFFRVFAFAFTDTDWVYSLHL